MSNLFETASRKKLRFAISKGEISVEQLWDLPLTSKSGDSLNGLANKYNRNSSVEIDFTADSKTETVDELDRLRFHIILHIIGVRKNEAQANQQYLANQHKIAILKEALLHKEHQEILNKSPEELKKEIERLQA